MEMRVGLVVVYLLVSGLVHIAFASPLQAIKRDAPFEDVRTLLKQDHSTPDKFNHPEKYFHEAKFHTHYDGRFASYATPQAERHRLLVPLVQTYLSIMADIGIETFLMHGTLLGWYWNRRIMPWDDDIDMMVVESGVHRLAAYHNLTVHTFYVPSLASTRQYLLEVNPHYADPSINTVNTVDARWIDMESGLFIDITTIRRDQAGRAAGIDGAMMVKDKHRYSYDDIFPLRSSIFESVHVRIPSAYGNILVEEYGPEALTQDYFNQFMFNSTKQEWIADG